MHFHDVCGFPLLVTSVKRHKHHKICALSVCASLNCVCMAEQERRALVAEAMEVAEFQPGKLVFRQGDAGDRFFLIKSGAAVVSKGQGADRQVLTRLTEGGYFGERALIKSEKRCRSRSPASRITALPPFPSPLKLYKLRLAAPPHAAAVVLCHHEHCQRLSCCMHPPIREANMACSTAMHVDAPAQEAALSSLSAERA